MINGKMCPLFCGKSNLHRKGIIIDRISHRTGKKEEKRELKIETNSVSKLLFQQ